jgi:Uma2 family endonuclease
MAGMVQIARHSFTVDEYNRMGAAGIFPDGVRTELIEGEIVEMAPIGSGHASVVVGLADIFYAGLARNRATISIQNPLELSDRTQPQPDVMVLAHRSDRYVGHHPVPRDVELLIEVSDTTLQWDRDVKLPLYAREGVQEVWLVDLSTGAILVYREPEAGAYNDVQVASRGDVISPTAFPDLSIEVNYILGT